MTGAQVGDALQTEGNDALEKAEKGSTVMETASIATAGTSGNKKAAGVEKSLSGSNKSGDGEEKSAKMVSVKELFKYASSSDNLYMGLGTFFCVLSAVPMPGFVILIGETLDKLQGDPDQVREEINFLAIIFLVLGVGAMAAGYFAVYFWSMAGERQAETIRKLYVKAILRQDIAWFDEHQAGQLPTAVASNMAKIQDGLGRKMCDVLINLVGFFLALATAFYVEWRIALVLLAAIPFIGASMGFTIKMMASASKESTLHYARAGAVATETIAGVRTVASLTSEEAEHERYKSHLEGARKAGVKAGFMKGAGAGVMFGAFYLTYGLAFWFGSQLVAREINRDCTSGCVTGGTVLSAIFGVLFGAMFLGQMTPGTEALTSARSSAVEVFETIDRVPPIDVQDTSGRTLDSVRGEINFQSVNFSYPARPDDLVYSNFNLTVKAGQTVALVGPSGGGKSTVAKLLLRFYDPQGGQVTVDGVNIKDLTLKWYRHQIGYVGQEPVLFGGSIRSNIAQGKPGCSDDDIVAATQAANAHAFISAFPMGYDTEVGEGGMQLSGGQKQRIAIARAIIADPAILLLDEATSALDSESEKVVQKALDDLHAAKARSTIVIAHRLSTIKNADQIAVVSGRMVTELGTHNELLQRNGIYAELCAASGVGAEGGEEEERRRTSLSAAKDTGRGRKKSYVEETKDSKLQGLSESKMGGTGADKDKEEEEEEDVPPMPISKLWNMNKPEWGWMALGVVGALMAGCCFPLEGVFISKITTALYIEDADEMKSEVAKWALAFVYLCISGLIGHTILDHAFAVSGEGLTKRLREQTFIQTLRHDIGWFDEEKNSTAHLTNKLETEAAKVQLATGHSLAYKLQVACTLLIGVGLGFYFSWRMALVCLGCIPFVAAAGIIQLAMLSGSYGDEEGLDGGSGAGEVLGSALSSVTTVSAMNMQDDVSNKYGKILSGAVAERQKRAIAGALAFGYSQGSIFLVFGLLFWVGGIFISKGQVSFENMFSAMFVIIIGAFGVGQISGSLGAQTDGAKAATRLFRIIDDKLSIDPLSKEGAKPVDTDYAVSFKNINFCYPTRPDVQIYENMNLDIPAGKTVALVGPSGCGKSTCLALLQRFYDPASGTVLLNGRDTKELNVRWLRGQIGYVGQEPVMFNGTIRENILRGFPDATQEQIESACKVANAHNFIMEFEDKYDTSVGEKSALLSGGQKQRIAIARAIIKDPAILIFDEATSALDNESERQVQEALNGLQSTGKCTTIVVAHRLSTVRDADAIAVFGEGVVKELGTHEELLKNKDGTYNMLWQQQQLGSNKKK